MAQDQANVVVSSLPYAVRLQRHELLTEMAQHFHALEALLDAGLDWPERAVMHCEAWAAIMGLDLASRT